MREIAPLRGSRVALPQGPVRPSQPTPIHGRQPVILPRGAWRRWLTASDWPADLAAPSPAGALRATQTR